MLSVYPLPTAPRPVGPVNRKKLLVLDPSARDLLHRRARQPQLVVAEGDSCRAPALLLPLRDWGGPALDLAADLEAVLRALGPAVQTARRSTQGPRRLRSFAGPQAPSQRGTPPAPFPNPHSRTVKWPDRHRLLVGRALALADELDLALERSRVADLVPRHPPADCLRCPAAQRLGHPLFQGYQEGHPNLPSGRLRSALVLRRRNPEPRRHPDHPGRWARQTLAPRELILQLLRARRAGWHSPPVGTERERVQDIAYHARAEFPRRGLLRLTRRAQPPVPQRQPAARRCHRAVRRLQGVWHRCAVARREWPHAPPG